MLLYKVSEAGVGSVVSLLKGRRRVAKPAPKAEIQQWENEGGGTSIGETGRAVPDRAGREGDAA